jgi:Methyltransferase domain
MGGERNENFEDLAWLFCCDSRNRGIIAQDFDEAALLWRAVKESSGNILEIGRKRAGSTVLLAAAGGSRAVYSLDLRLRPHQRCKEYLNHPSNQGRIELRIANSRESLPGLTYGFLFIDGDHSFDGVLADVLAHWNALKESNGKPGLAAFHDAVPNDNYKWRDEHRRLHRFWIRFKNKFRKQQKPEISPDYEVGVNRVCQKLVDKGLAERWGAAGSMLVLKKLADLPADFRNFAPDSSS